MPDNALNQVMRHLRQMILLQEKSSDDKLLGLYVDRRDDAAFEALVRRHGKMVFGVCRRILRDHHDAEEAFQAVFLVLVRKAASVVPREKVGNWLFGVARQTAIRVKALKAKRRRREIQVSDTPEPAVPSREGRDDVSHLVDQELARLPEKYRVAIVLCDLEGRTRKEVAQELGWPEGTVATRLTRGRAMLAKRLVKHGLLFSGEALAVVLSQNVASAFLPPALVSTTMKAAFLMAAGQTAAISTEIAALTQGVILAMFLSKMKTLVVVSFLACVVGIGLGVSVLPGQTTGPGPQQQNEKQSGPGAKGKEQDGKKDNEKELEFLRRYLVKINQEAINNALGDAFKDQIKAALQREKDADVQRENAAKWEYKVVIFASDLLDDLAKSTKQLNDLAAEGWEYVGMVGNYSSGGGNGFGPRVGYVGRVAFKRLKK